MSAIPPSCCRTGRAIEHGFAPPARQVVRERTTEPARVYGLGDSGIFAPGERADLNVIDPDRVRLAAPYIAHRSAHGRARLLQRATGYRATIAAGVCIHYDGEDTGARPGSVVRGIRS